MGKLKESATSAAGSYQRGSGSLGPFRRVTRRSPCPVCGKPDFCLVRDDGALALCTRVASDKRAPGNSNAWVHWLASEARAAVGPLEPAPQGNEPRAGPDTRDAAYRALLAALPCSSAHAADLRRRGLTPDDHGTLPIRGRAAAARAVVERIGDAAARGVPGLYVRDDGRGRYWTLAGAVGLLVPCVDAAGRIVALKIRADGDGPRYSYLTSSHKGGAAAELAVHVPPGFAGDRAVVRLTEGELKATIATARTGVLTVSVPGVTNWARALPVLAELGAKRVLVAFDADHRSNPMVARALVGLCDALDVAGYELALELWDGDHKGVDDALAAGATVRVLEQWRGYVDALRAPEPAEPAEPAPSRPVRQVLARLRPASPRVALDAAREAIRDALEQATPGARTVVRVSPGTGKSVAMVQEAVRRAGQGQRVALLVPTYAMLAEVRAQLLAAGQVHRVARGIDQVTDATGAPACTRGPEVAAAQARGLSPRTVLCRGRFEGLELGPACGRLETCPAASPWDGPADAPVALAVHAMAALVLEPKDPPDLVVVDETPGDLQRVATFTLAELAAAAADTADVRGTLRPLALELLAGALQYAAPLPEAIFRYATSAAGADTWDRWERNGLPVDPASARDKAVAILGDRKVPLSPNARGLVALRSPRQRDADTRRWQVFAALVGLAEGGTSVHEGDQVHVTWPSATARALAQTAAAVAVLDGTADVGAWSAALRTEPAVIDATVAERAVVHRAVVVTRDANRKAWCPGARARWTPGLRGAVRALVTRIVDAVPAGATVAWATFRPVTDALRRAWETGEGDGADLLEPLRDHGVTVRWTYYGATDTRGVNVHGDCDASVTLGDPRPNVGQAKAKGTSPAAKAAADLAQFHDRLRGVVRDRELWSWHAGTVVPQGQWDEQSTTLLEPRLGRPVAGTDVRDLAGALLEHFGSLAELARASGLNRKTVAAARRERVSSSTADRLRRVAAGVHFSPVLTEGSVDGCSRLKRTSVPERSRELPPDVRAPAQAAALTVAEPSEPPPLRFRFNLLPSPPPGNGDPPGAPPGRDDGPGRARGAAEGSRALAGPLDVPDRGRGNRTPKKDLAGPPRTRGTAAMEVFG